MSDATAREAAELGDVLWDDTCNCACMECGGPDDTHCLQCAADHRIVDGYCFDCYGGCLVGFGNPSERCPVEGCIELPEDHHHPACNDPRHDEIEAWYRQALEARAPDVEQIVRAALRVVDQTTPLAVGEPLIQKAIRYATNLSRLSKEEPK